MRTKPDGSECKLYYDTANPIEVGHYVVSSGGSGYLVQEARRSQTNPCRYNLTCLRCNPVEIPIEATIHPLYWYKRGRKKKRKMFNVWTLNI